MTKIKTLLAAALCAAGLLTTVNAQNYTDGRVDAYTKPNPAKPIQIDWGTVIDNGDNTVTIVFIVSGIGRWTLFEVCEDITICCLAAGSGNGAGRFYSYTVPKSNYVDCFINLTNVHGWGGTQQ